MIGGTTDRTRVQPCSVCGVAVTHREHFGLIADAPVWWSPVRHTAPCGRPCMGGGVRPHPVDTSGGDGLAHAHRADACGAPGCGGGQHPVSVDLTCARRCGAVADDAQTALVCPDCGAAMIPRVSSFGPFYGCERFPACRATHGAHPDGRPLGTPADAATKAARIRAHAAFDVLWKGGAMKRNEAYYRLSKALGITRAECHIANFNAAMCERVVEAVANLRPVAADAAPDAARERGR